MKRERRTKNEMERMNLDIRFYLFETNLDPHKAYDAMVKEHLLSGKTIPYYIKGIKDFIKVSEELKQQIGRTEKATEHKNSKENDIDKLKGITPEQYKADILPLMKQTDDKRIKMALADLWFYVIRENDFKAITEEDIRNLKTVNVI